MHSSRRRAPVVLTLLLASASIAIGAAPANAEAGVHSLRPAGAHGAVAVYRLRGLEPREIRRAELRRGKGRARKLDLARVRRAAALGRLRVRVLQTREMRAQARRYRARYGTAATELRIVADARAQRRATQRRARSLRRIVLRYATRSSRRARLVIVTETQAAAPTTRALSGSCSGSGLGSFGVGAWPSGCWRPYGDSSPFNRALDGDPRVVANSQAIVSKVVGSGPSNLIAGDADTKWDYSHPIYWSKPSDPVFTIHCAEDWGACEIEGAQVRIPDAARASGGGDGHLTVIDQQSGWEYDLWQVRDKPAGGGTLSVSWGGKTQIGGDGLGSNATAANFGGAAGVIRAQELAAGRIDHALFLVIKCGSGAKVYPAEGTGSRCSDTTNAPPMGSRFQLAMSDGQIDGLSVPAWKKTILRAMAHYGMYFGDTGGSGFGLQFESGSSYTSFGVEDAMVSYARQAGVPRNGEGKYTFDVAAGVDWQHYLRVIDPCEAQGAC
jgi:hypothetical protein